MFEKGKWYYNKTYKYKIKYLKESDTKAIVYTDIVSVRGEHNHYPFGTTGVGYTDNKNWVLIEDLSEIQQYLPDNHPDKIQNNNEEILEICKQYYPVGTKFESLWSKRQFKVLNSDIRFEFKNQIITVLVDNADTDDGYAAVWDRGKGFAKIISTPNQEVKDDFVLPKKWCIKIPDYKTGLFIIENFVPEQVWYKNYPNNVNYFCFDNTFFACWAEKQPKNYTEITFEQFKKYVLNENLIVETKGNDINIDTKVFEHPEEIYIPTITKPKKKIDYTINSSVFADIKVNLPEKPKKVVKPIVLEKFNLII